MSDHPWQPLGRVDRDRTVAEGTAALPLAANTGHLKDRHVAVVRCCAQEQPTLKLDVVFEGRLAPCVSPADYERLAPPHNNPEICARPLTGAEAGGRIAKRSVLPAVALGGVVSAALAVVVPASAIVAGPIAAVALIPAAGVALYKALKNRNR